MTLPNFFFEFSLLVIHLKIQFAADNLKAEWQKGLDNNFFFAYSVSQQPKAQQHLPNAPNV